MAIRTGTGTFSRTRVEDTPLYSELIEIFGDGDPITVARIREACECKAMLDEIDATKRSRATRGAERLRWSRQYDALLSSLEGGNSDDAEPEEPPTAIERRFPRQPVDLLVNDARVDLRFGWEPGNFWDRLHIATRDPLWREEAIEILERHDPTWLRQWREWSAPGGRYEQAARQRMERHTLAKTEKSE